MPKLTRQLPKYRPHHASGQAVVSLNGKQAYPSPHGSAESRVRYDEIGDSRP